MARRRRSSLYRVEVWPDPEASPRGGRDVWVADGGLDSVELPWADCGWIALATWATRWGRSVDRRQSTEQSDRYTYTVAWDPKEKVFVATVAEFPALSSRSEDQVRALLDLVRQVRGHLEEIEDEREEGSSSVPAPPGGQIETGSPRSSNRNIIDIRTRKSVDGGS